MSMLSRVPRGTSSPIIVRLAAACGTTLLAATCLQTGAAQGLTVPTLGAPALSPSAALGLASAAPATSVGRLAPSGCVATGTTVVCDLWASAGTATVAGQVLPIWGFSTTNPAAVTNPGTPTAPGPNLVVNQGDSVTVTLHDALAGQTMSLAFPGVAATQFAAGLGSAGVTSGSTSTYTFTASRPGTFLYEAGQTDNQARQVAMGLAGALVVLPTDQLTTTDYTDESVLVLSEIDPDLANARNLAGALDPSAFDMRKYNPRYRLINGNTFPEIPAIATNAGNTVKLHYVNVGQRQHPMTVLGAVQKTTARDGHPLRFPDSQVTAVLEPGTTADTLVSLPSDGTTKFTLYESGQHLDSAGLPAGAGSTQVAFGGMMTVLDTQAPVAPTDVVGPKASAVALVDNPATGQSDVAVSATVDDTRSGASAVQAAEYLVDDPNGVAPGFGNIMNPSTPGAVSTAVTGTLTVAQMSLIGDGKHTIYVRGEDTYGNWGALAAGTLTIQGYGASTTGAYLSPTLTNLNGAITLDATGDASATSGTVQGADYLFSDTDLTTAQLAARWTPMTLNRKTAIVAESAVVDNSTGSAFAQLSGGVHTAWIRSLDNRGLWGLPARVDFTVDLDGPTTQAGLMPSPTNGLVAAPGTPGSAMVSAIVDDGTTGSTITDAEAFVNPRSITGVVTGTGLQLVPDNPTLTSTTEHFHGSVPLSQLRSLPDGAYHLFVHGKDAAGNWGPFQDTTFTVDKTAPTLGALTAPATAESLTTITVSASYSDPNTTVTSLGAAEYWWGPIDPGVGHGTRVTATITNGVLTFAALPVTGVAPGSRVLNVRASDLAGNWSNVSTATITVTPAILLRQLFTAAPLAAPWSQPSGAASVVGGVLQVTSGSAAGYLTTGASVSALLPSAQATTRTTVDVDTSGVTRAGWTTIVSATGSTGQVYGLQVQRTAAGQTQLRTVMNRAGGLAPLNGAIVVLTTPGKATVTLAWRAGPARATSTVPAGQLTLSLDGGTTTVSTSTGTTAGLSVAGISLGVVGAPAAPGLRQTLRLGTLTVTP